jgi:hypothetical protein
MVTCPITVFPCSLNNVLTSAATGTAFSANFDFSELMAVLFCWLIRTDVFLAEK